MERNKNDGVFNKAPDNFFVETNEIDRMETSRKLQRIRVGKRLWRRALKFNSPKWISRLCRLDFPEVRATRHSMQCANRQKRVRGGWRTSKWQNRGPNLCGAAPAATDSNHPTRTPTQLVLLSSHSRVPTSKVEIKKRCLSAERLKAGKLEYVRIREAPSFFPSRRVFKIPDEDEHRRDERTRTPKFQRSIGRISTKQTYVEDNTRGQELVDLVFRHLNLLETAYFGLRYIDANNQTHRGPHTPTVVARRPNLDGRFASPTLQLNRFL
ncbi:unnamed protein product [Bemisia tabaci]|uniref:FERM domain-containing protein n=1 Tax=Bemisia tabaci TaxID=7038 RepID=A0A9P0A2B2_BEMTA|nr:unnamed protein product [Bemisia tabaci]